MKLFLFMIQNVVSTLKNFISMSYPLNLSLVSHIFVIHIHIYTSIHILFQDKEIKLLFNIVLFLYNKM